jgi:UDP-N-acetylenolpyruvoylglucosamine reductase
MILYPNLAHNTILNENCNSSVRIDICDKIDEHYKQRINVFNNYGIIEMFAGEQLMTLIRSAAFFGFGGMEDLAGIPSSIGGAFKMNAGAFKHWFLDFIEEATFVDNDGTLIVLPKEKMQFGYRTQKVLNKGSVLISCKVKLQKIDSEVSNAKIEDILNKRNMKQPLEFPSCGSVFKNITRADGSKLYAWQMIEYFESVVLKFQKNIPLQLIKQYNL